MDNKPTQPTDPQLAIKYGQNWHSNPPCLKTRRKGYRLKSGALGHSAVMKVVQYVIYLFTHIIYEHYVEITFMSLDIKTNSLKSAA